MAATQSWRTLATRRTSPTRLCAPCRASSKATVRAAKRHPGSLCRVADERCTRRDGGRFAAQWTPRRACPGWMPSSTPHRPACSRRRSSRRMRCRCTTGTSGTLSRGCAGIVFCLPCALDGHGAEPTQVQAEPCGADGHGDGRGHRGGYRRWGGPHGPPRMLRVPAIAFCGGFPEVQATTVRAAHSRKPAVPLIPVIDHLAAAAVRHDANAFATRTHDVASLRN